MRKRNVGLGVEAVCQIRVAARNGESANGRLSGDVVRSVLHPDLPAAEKAPVVVDGRSALHRKRCTFRDIDDAIDRRGAALGGERAATSAHDERSRRWIGGRIAVQRAVVERNAAWHVDGRRFRTEHAAFRDQDGFDVDRQADEAEVARVLDRELLARAEYAAHRSGGGTRAPAHVEAV